MNKTRKSLIALALTALAAPAAANATDYCVGGPTNCPGGASNQASVTAALDLADNADNADRVFIGGVQTGPVGGFSYNRATGPVEILGDGTARLEGPDAGTRILNVNAADGSRVHDLGIRVPAHAPNGNQYFVSTGADADHVVVDSDPTQNADPQIQVVQLTDADFTDGSVTAPPSGNGNSHSLNLNNSGTLARTTIDGAVTVGTGGGGNYTIDRVQLIATVAGVEGHGTVSVNSSLIRVLGNVGGAAGVLAYDNAGSSDVAIANSTIVREGAPGTTFGVAANPFQNVAAHANIVVKSSIISGFNADRDRLNNASPLAESNVTVTNSRYDESRDASAGQAGGAMSPATGTLGASNTNAVPTFVGAPDYRLTAANVALIDKGEPAAAPGGDLDGNPLLQDGDGNCSVLRDMGAYERPTIANPACNPAPAADVSQQQGTPAQGGGQQGGGGGAAALRLSAVGYKKGKLSFTLNYATKLQLKVDRKKPRILSVKAGKNVLKLRLKPGRHKLQLAGAGVSKTLSVRVR